MKKEDLIALGVSEENAEKILGLYEKESGVSSEKLKKTETELEASKKSLKEISEKLKGYDGVDVKALQKSVSDWEKKYNDDIRKLNFEHSLDGALSKAKAKNLKAVKSMLDVDKLTLTKAGNIDGLDEQLEALKKSDGYMFDSDTPAPRISSQTVGGINTVSDDFARGVMGLPISK